ncbi:MAG: polysaccharide deacetylase family protein [Bacilli bacterium]|nr:polysaccharide deacetylase family protein [Bacilli bacterium]
MKLSKKSKNVFIESFLIVLCSIFIVSCLFILNKNNFKEQNEIETFIEPAVSVDSDVNINEVVSEYLTKFNLHIIIKDYKSKYNIKSYYVIDNRLLSFLVYDEAQSIYTSIILDYSKGEKLDITSLLKVGKEQDFWDKVNELIYLKYPKFIADVLTTEEGNIAYEIKENEMILRFSGYTFEPEYNKEIYIKVNYNEIKDYLNFNYKLDSEYENENGFHYDKNKTTIAITFDDGPSGEKTKVILQSLIDNKMHSTFFMVGNKMSYQSNIITDIINSGNEIGSHTYSHINMKRVNVKKVTEELTKTNDIFNSITGQNIKLVRPPYGAYKKALIKDYPYSFVLWNIDTNDWRYHNVEYLTNYILDNALDGNVILMHDSYNTSVEAIQKVLPILYAKDIQVVTISELAAIKGYTLEDGVVYHSFK